MKQTVISVKLVLKTLPCMPGELWLDEQRESCMRGHCDVSLITR